MAKKFPSAADRDAAKRAAAARQDTLQAADFRFLTRHLSETEMAATVAALAALRATETKLLKKRERIDRDPWRRSQRSQRRIEDFFADA